MNIYISILICSTLITFPTGNDFGILIKNENNTLPCPLHCLSTFYYEKMDHYLFENANMSKEFYGPTNDIEGDITQLNAGQFRKFCILVFRPFASCLRKCAYSVLRQDINKMLRPVKFLCVDNYHEIRRHFDCYTKIKREYSPCCKKLYCEGYKSSTTNPTSRTRHASNPKFRIMRHQSQRPNQNEEQLKSCKLLKCTLPCERELIQRNCGSAMAKLMTIDFIKVYLESSKNLMVNSRASWPEECEQIF